MNFRKTISNTKTGGKIWLHGYHICWVGFFPCWRLGRDWGPYPSRGFFLQIFSRGFPSCMADFFTLLRRFTVFPSYFPSLWMNSSVKENTTFYPGTRLVSIKLVLENFLPPLYPLFAKFSVRTYHASGLKFIKGTGKWNFRRKLPNQTKTEPGKYN